MARDMSSHWDSYVGNSSADNASFPTRKPNSVREVKRACSAPIALFKWAVSYVLVVPRVRDVVDYQETPDGRFEASTSRDSDPPVTRGVFMSEIG